MMTKRTYALIISISLILMAVVAMYVFGAIMPNFNTDLSVEELSQNISADMELYRTAVLGIVLVIILDFIVSYWVFELFKDQNRNMAMLSAILRTIYTIVFSVACFELSKNLNAADYGPEGLMANVLSFEKFWNTGLGFLFGPHLIVLGLLVRESKVMPNVLGLMVLLAGISYSMIPLLKVLPLAEATLSTIEIVLAIPMTVGELGFAFWLLFKKSYEVKPQLAL